MKKYLNHKYLLSQYLRVDTYLSISNSDEDFLDVVVSFCVVIEKMLKIKLYNKNPILIFDTGSIKNVSILSLVALKKEKNLDIKTIKIAQVLERVKFVFRRFLSDDEIQVITDIYEIRNYFIHSHGSDIDISYDKEDIVKKMGTIWEKISKDAIKIFGKEKIKNARPTKKYTQQELEKVLIDEVREKIKSNDPFTWTSYVANMPMNGLFTGVMSLDDEKCPRCDQFGFSMESNENYTGYGGTFPVFNSLNLSNGGLFSSRYTSNLYKCKICNLELTKKEFEIAKKINLDKSKNDRFKLK